MFIFVLFAFFLSSSRTIILFYSTGDATSKKSLSSSEPEQHCCTDKTFKLTGFLFVLQSSHLLIFACLRPPPSSSPFAFFPFFAIAAATKWQENAHRKRGAEQIKDQKTGNDEGIELRKEKMETHFGYNYIYISVI